MAFTTHRFRICLSLAALLALLVVSGSAHAATITVNSTDDSAQTDGACTLREAIKNANAMSDTTGGDCAAGTGTDTINFSVSGTITLSTPGTTYNVPGGVHWVSLPAISNSSPGSLTIDGSGHDIIIDSHGYLPLIVMTGATLHLQTLSIINGNGQANGAGSVGAIEVYGTATIDNSSFQNDIGNSVIYVAGYGGPLTVSNSTFSNNPTWAITTDTPELTTVTNSTFSANQNALNIGSPFVVTNTTFFNNFGAGQGLTGAVYLAFYRGGHLTISNSILADDAAGNCENSSYITDDGYNISDDSTCGFATSTAANGQTIGDNVSDVNIALDLLGLQNNGGLTQTIALESGSYAIDAIPSGNCPAIDQRGFTRRDGGETACDIGAFEYGATPPGAPPTIKVTSPTKNAVYALDQPIAAAYTCTDSIGGDAVTVCSGNVANGSDIDTASVGAKTFTVNATDSYNLSSTASANYTVEYNICPQYDQSRSVKSGSTIPIKLQLCDINGTDVSSSDIALHATGVTMVSSNATELLQDAGDSNPDDDFRFDSSLGATGGYIFNLSTKSFPSGTFQLQFTAGSDPTVHVAQFQVR